MKAGASRNPGGYGSTLVSLWVENYCWVSQAVAILQVGLILVQPLSKRPSRIPVVGGTGRRENRHGR